MNLFPTKVYKTSKFKTTNAVFGYFTHLVMLETIATFQINTP